MIKFDHILWTDSVVRHVAAHDLTKDEVESVLRGKFGRDGRSGSSGRHLRFGYTSTGRYILVAYEIKQGRTATAIRPVTAYEVEPN